MIDYIKGQIVELTPTELILENAGIGYSILISLQTYEAFQMKTQAVAYIHHYIREDEELYYGFATKDERELFRLLIGVSGIGVASARMMLSTLTSEEIRGFSRQGVHRPVQIGVRLQGRLPLQVHNRQRPLGCCRVVQIHQRLPVHGAGKDRELCAKLRD